MTNRLKIDAVQVKIEFTGPHEDIRRGYEMTRELLVHHFEERLREVEAERRRDPDATELLHLTPEQRSGGAWSPPEHFEAMHVSISLSSGFYNKVCILERDEFEASVFQNVFLFDRLNRLFIRHEQGDVFGAYFTIGKVLWRELTANGRAAVRKEGE